MTNTRHTYKVVRDAGIYTVLNIDADGEAWDLNADGELCTEPSQCIEFIQQLLDEGCIDEAQASDLVAELAEVIR